MLQHETNVVVVFVTVTVRYSRRNLGANRTDATQKGPSVRGKEAPDQPAQIAPSFSSGKFRVYGDGALSSVRPYLRPNGRENSGGALPRAFRSSIQDLRAPRVSFVSQKVQIPKPHSRNKKSCVLAAIGVILDDSFPQSFESKHNWMKLQVETE